MADLETIRARLVADASQFVAELEKASGALGPGNGKPGLEEASRRSTKGMQAVRSGMVALANQATGVPGPISKIVQGLLALGGGSTIVLGVAAGIGAIAFAVRALTAD